MTDRMNCLLSVVLNVGLPWSFSATSRTRTRFFLPVSVRNLAEGSVLQPVPVV